MNIFKHITTGWFNGNRNRAPGTGALLIGIALMACSCSHMEPHGGKENPVNPRRSTSNDVLTTRGSITNATAQGELVPAGILAGVRPARQKVTLLAYSEFGRRCDVLGVNGYTTDSAVPNGCPECEETCPAKEITEHDALGFEPSPLAEGDGFKLPVQQFGPVVGVRDFPVDRVTGLGRYISSRSPGATSGNLSSACFGPAGTCGGSASVKLAMAAAPLATQTSDAGFAIFNDPSVLPLLASHHIPDPGGYSHRTYSYAGWDPAISTIARAAGHPISGFPARVSLQSGVGPAYFRAINRLGIGETVLQAHLSTPSGDKEPLWHIRILYGKQISDKGFLVEVNSANNMRWQAGNPPREQKQYLSDREVAEIIENHIKTSSDPATGDITVELEPTQGSYIPLIYLVSINRDAELMESITSTVIEDDLAENMCKEIY